MSTHTTACPLDCPDHCSLTIRVEEGRVTHLDGNEVNPVTRGYICAKVRRFPEALYGPERIGTPAFRDGPKGSGRFRRATWNEALDAVARTLVKVRDEHGGEAIVPLSYGGSNGLLSQDTTDARLFWRLGASNLKRTVCAAPTGRAAMGLYGKMPGVSYEDYPHARCIVIWGANPAASGIHLMPYLQEAVANGAKLVVVDPRRTKLAAKAHLHLAIRPGTDLPLALAVARWLFEHDKADHAFLAEHAIGVDAFRERLERWTTARAAEVCGVDAASIEAMAHLYASATPALIRCGWGLERNRNGGSAVAAVLALPAVAGKFGVRGGGYTLSNSAAWPLTSTAGTAASPPNTRAINMNRLGEALTELTGPRVHALFVYNANPLVTVPEQEKVRQGLLRDDLFTVVFDSFLTDTALYADVILPAATFLERRELSRGYGSLSLQRGEPVVDRIGDSRSNHEVFLELVERTGLAQPGDPRTEIEIETAILRQFPETAAALEKGNGFTPPPFGARPTQFVDVWPRTPDRKVHLVPEDLDAEAPLGLYGFASDPATPSYPLALISPATHRTISSTLGQLVRGQIAIEMHPEDARARRLEHGDLVRVWNASGEVVCRLAVTATLRPGVVLLPKGLWMRHTENGRTANALCPDTLTDLGEGACFNDARVEVARAD
ncbi:MAG TPA: molybdopterin-dependent oxidoreductase [Candidatus Eisenbacteria bacterium]|nr:molybdopterin-dependent oxidoreductase [Candidatus Eisenbacteria bacterium]